MVGYGWCKFLLNVFGIVLGFCWWVCRDVSEIVLGGVWVVDLLSRNVVYWSVCRDCGDLGGCCGRVIFDIFVVGIFNVWFGLCVFSLMGKELVFVFYGFVVDDEFRKCVFVGSCVSFVG